MKQQRGDRRRPWAREKGGVRGTIEPRRGGECSKDKMISGQTKSVEERNRLPGEAKPRRERRRREGGAGAGEGEAG